jgi:hypothetical protein
MRALIPLALLLALVASDAILAAPGVDPTITPTSGTSKSFETSTQDTASPDLTLFKSRCAFLGNGNPKQAFLILKNGPVFDLFSVIRSATPNTFSAYPDLEKMRQSDLFASKDIHIQASLVYVFWYVLEGKQHGGDIAFVKELLDHLAMVESGEHGTTFIEDVKSHIAP